MESNMFKSVAFGGFDKQDVIGYIERTAREAAEALALELSVQTARAMVPYTDGWYLMTPFRRTGLITRIMASLQAGGDPGLDPHS